MAIILKKKLYAAVQIWCHVKMWATWKTCGQRGMTEMFPAGIKLFVLTQALINPCILISNIQTFRSVSLHYLWPTSAPAMSSTLCSLWWMNLRICRRSKFDSQRLHSRAAFKDITDDTRVLRWNKHVGGKCCTSHLISRFQTFHMEAGRHVALGLNISQDLSQRAAVSNDGTQPNGWVQWCQTSRVAGPLPIFHGH